MEQPSHPRRTFASPRARLAAVLLALGVIGALTVRDYGLTIDEPGAVFLPKWHYDYVVYDKPFDREIASYDGTLLSFVAEGIYQAKQWAQRPSKYDFERTFSMKHRPVEQIIAGRTRVRHPLTFATFLLAAAAVAGLVALLAGVEYAWLGALILALFPRFWGHSFFNFKDVPFAALFTCATLYGAYLVAQFLAADAPPSPDAAADQDGPRPRRRWPQLVLHSLAFGVLVGLLCGVRVGGFVVIGFLLATHVAMRLVSRTVWRNALPVAACYVLMAAVCFGVTILCYPSAWSDPFGWFPKALGAVSQYPWGKPVLFEGKFVPSAQLPWHYLPKWIVISVPVLWLACASGGMIVLIALLLRRAAPASAMQRAAVMLLLLQCFAIPVLVIARGSTMYDGMRHNLFVLPALAVAATCFVAWVYRRMPTLGARVGACALLAVLAMPILWDMVRLHPYQYVYFNRTAGSLPGAHERYETDYWGLSLREGMEWLNDHGDRSRPIVTGAPHSIVRPFADPGWRFESLKDDAALVRMKPFYYLAIPKHGLQRRFPNASTIHGVQRQGGTLTIVQIVE